MGVPQNGWFMENPMKKLDELGVAHFRTPNGLVLVLKIFQLPRAQSRCRSQGPQGPVAAAEGAEGRSTAVGRVVASAPRLRKFGHGKGESSMAIGHFYGTK
jgi:hypothetical protein